MESYFKHLERLKRINSLISRKATGTPAELSSRLGISKRQLFNILDDFRIYGAPIEYCRLKRTYYYKEEFNLRIKFSMEILSDNRLEKIYGEGVTCFFQCNDITLYNNKLPISFTH